MEPASIKQVAKSLESIAWGTAEERNKLLTCLVNTHLTNQQRIVAMVHHLLFMVNEYPYEDDRNRQAKKYAAAVIKAVGKDYHFPII